MLDNQLIKGISDHWDHCLKKIIIDVKSSYRNLRFQFFSRRAGQGSASMLRELLSGARKNNSEQKLLS